MQDLTESKSKSSSTFVFLKWKYISYFHVITEEPSQHVWSDSVIISQSTYYYGWIDLLRRVYKSLESGGLQ